MNKMFNFSESEIKGYKKSENQLDIQNQKYEITIKASVIVYSCFPHTHFGLCFVIWYYDFANEGIYG